MPLLSPDSRFFKGDPNRAVQWFDHHPVLVIALMTTASLGQDLATIAGLDALYWAFSVPGSLVSLFFVYAVYRHLRGFCDTCFARPLGGPVAAERKARQLRLQHWIGGHPKAVLLVCLGALLSISFVRHGWTDIAFMAATAWPMAYLLQSQRTHAWLAPWCPQCNEGGGDLVEDSPPLPTGQKAA